MIEGDSRVDGTNTIVVPLPVGPTLALVIGGIVACVIGWTGANPLLALLDLGVMIAAMLVLGRAWAERYVTRVGRARPRWQRPQR